ncbi:MAG: DNA methyltransferase [Patescibacteria group bacterium]
MPTPNHRYWFVLGRESLIAAAEIDAVLGFPDSASGSRFTIGKNYSLSILKTDANFDSKKLINRLGGTIKIAEEIADNVGEKEMKEKIFSELRMVEGKINFGLSFYNTEIILKEIKNLGLEIKKALKNEGRSVRYVENKELTLSSVAVEKNGLTARGREFLVERKDNLYSIAKTEAVQPFENFSDRDFGRPGRDDLSGMLPPKLAMILINLAQTPLNSVLLDPFCGSGTILSEAMLLEYKNLIGSDTSEKAVENTKINIDWVAKKFHPELPDIKIFKNEIKELSKKLHPNSIDAIVTEPYLGKPLRGQETKEELVKQISELKKLYLIAFVQFKKILKSDGKVVFLIPRFKFKNEWLIIDCENEIKKIGFKILPFFENKMPLLYARPDQRVTREIWRFEKN